MAHLAVFESDFGSYYLGPHLETFLSRARSIRQPKWLPWFVRQWLWPTDYKVLLKAWEFHDQMEAIALKRWEANEDTSGIIEISKTGKLVVTEPTELDYYHAAQ